jgi:hypothetical protein
VIQLSRICTFPLKSGAVIDQTSAELGPRGIVGDRRWMVVDATGRFLTARTVPSMVRIAAVPVDGGLCLSLDGARRTVPAPTSGPRMAVTVWGDTVEALRADDGGWLSARLGQDCQLVYMDDDLRRPVDADYAQNDDITSFADGFPILLISEGSLADLNRRLERPVSMDHFRPNLIVSGCSAFAEDGWRRIRIGAVELSLVKHCSRCVLTTVDPNTGLRATDGEPLRTLSGYRKTDRGVTFGQNALVTRPGRMERGDPVMVLS